MISEQTHKHIEQNEAFHIDCYAYGQGRLHERNLVGLIKPLFNMLICEKCHKTLDDDSQIVIRTALWNQERVFKSEKPSRHCSSPGCSHTTYRIAEVGGNVAMLLEEPLCSIHGEHVQKYVR